MIALLLALQDTVVEALPEEAAGAAADALATTANNSINKAGEQSPNANKKVDQPFGHGCKVKEKATTLLTHSTICYV